MSYLSGSRPWFSALLVMAALLLTSLCPAHAGSWKFSCTGSGSFTPTPSSLGTATTWTPPPAQMNSFHFGRYGALVASVGTACSATVS